MELNSGAVVGLKNRKSQNGSEATMKVSAKARTSVTRKKMVRGFMGLPSSSAAIRD
jgi:hypothetical protein